MAAAVLGDCIEPHMNGKVRAISKAQAAHDENVHQFDPIRLMDPGETSILLGVEERTLRNWRHQGIGPPYIRAGGFVRYRRIDVTDWQALNRRDPGSRDADPAA